MTASLAAINELAATRPTAGAPARLVAAWYERKAVLLHQIADTGPLSERDTFETLARQADQHANRLLADLPSGGGRTP